MLRLAFVLLVVIIAVSLYGSVAGCVWPPCENMDGKFKYPIPMMNRDN